jgi:hypothetical protein
MKTAIFEPENIAAALGIIYATIRNAALFQYFRYANGLGD